MAQLPSASREQLDIVRAVSAGKNVITNSVAGSGKTTTIMHVATVAAASDSPREVLVLTYNRKLRHETIARASRAGIPLEIHTYHSFAVKYLSSACINDRGMIAAIDGNWRRDLPHWDLIVIDEAQDMTTLYYRLVRKIVAGYPMIQYCIIGDDKQSIYDFNNADARFILLADQLYNSHLDWEHITLSTSYRVNSTHAAFVNKCLLGYEKIRAWNTGKYKPRYIIANLFDPNTLYNELQYYYSLGYSNGDIFVIAPSVRSLASPVRLFANLASMKGVPIFVPNSDDEQIDESVLGNKLVFSTFHQVKGLERKAVIVCGFDSTYFDFFKRGQPHDICPNEIYVATTRALELMSVFHHFENNFLPCLNRRHLMSTTQFIEGRRLSIKPPMAGIKRKYAVTDLCRHIPIDVIMKVMALLPTREISPVGDKIILKSVIRGKTIGGESSANCDSRDELSEAVADINGTAIPMYFEFGISGKLRVVKRLQVVRGELQYEEDQKTLSSLPVSKLLKTAAKNNAARSGYIFRINQIAKYDWMTPETLAHTDLRLHAKIPGANMAAFEAKYETADLFGFVDCMDHAANTLWEFKCTHSIEDIHLIQAALYKHLFIQHQKNVCEKLYEERFIVTDMIAQAESMRCLVYNILTEQTIEVTATPAQLEQVKDILIAHKQAVINKGTDAEFLSRVSTIV